MPAIDTIKIRNGVASLWSSTDPILSSGEIGYDTTNKIFKIGDGVLKWSNLTSINLTASNITNFNSAVSGLLQVTNIVPGSNISISSASGVYTINSSGGSIADPYDLGTYPLITISAQPATTTVGVNNPATVSVTAAATLPTATITYQWQNSTDGGTTWTNISGATSSSYTTPSLSAGTYRYRCQLSANLSLIYTATAVITSQASSFLAISRTNGTSTFTGQGNSALPYVRATTVLASSSDAIDYYRFTASASGTVYFSIEVIGDGIDVIFSKNAVVVKRQFGGSFTWTTCTASIAVVSGDVISVSYPNVGSGESTRNVSVYAA